MANVRDMVMYTEKRKKTTCPKGLLKSEAEIDGKIALKLLRGYYQIY
jgi:hypothetical protein